MLGNANFDSLELAWFYLVSLGLTWIDSVLHGLTCLISLRLLVPLASTWFDCLGSDRSYLVSVGPTWSHSVFTRFLSISVGLSVCVNFLLGFFVWFCRGLTRCHEISPGLA